MKQLFVITCAILLAVVSCHPPPPQERSNKVIDELLAKLNIHDIAFKDKSKIIPGNSFFRMPVSLSFRNMRMKMTKESVKRFDDVDVLVLPEHEIAFKIKFEDMKLASDMLVFMTHGPRIRFAMEGGIEEAIFTVTIHCIEDDKDDYHCGVHELKNLSVKGLTSRTKDDVSFPTHVAIFNKIDTALKAMVITKMTQVVKQELEIVLQKSPDVHDLLEHD